jgi:hypothetical protein
VSSNRLAVTPLIVGSSLIALAVLRQSFLLEWVGAFLSFIGLSYLAGRRAFPLALVVFGAGSLGDLAFFGGLPGGWVLTNYMVFIHSCVGSLLGNVLRKR